MKVFNLDITTGSYGFLYSLTGQRNTVEITVANSMRHWSD